MNRKRGPVFCQSLYDFPCRVTLGEDMPSFGLRRFKQGLQFIPADDEGFILRGDKKWLLYKGRRRSHRFTILGDTAFEYDCILEREPESNVITLLMAGAEYFDFFRQPDFVPEPFLKGSYAVYQKETVAGEGTGKLCHIHRPEIIDARGRRCWGELSVTGNELRITIPAQWLGEAKYPVLVDPTIGTTTVGSQTHWNNEDDGSYDQLYLEVSLAVNRFTVPDTLNGTATAFVYAYDSDYWGRCKPVLYSDNNNVPQYRRSQNENQFDIEVKSGKPAGWRSVTFQTNTSIASGNYIWFGLFCDWFAPRFDYGAKCYRDFWDSVGTDIPNTYPVWSVNYYQNFKLSMYFTYTASVVPQTYSRTLTQGITVTDTRKSSGNYKRSAMQTARITSALTRSEMFFIKCANTVGNVISLKRFPVFVRTMAEHIRAAMTNRENRFVSRKCTVSVNAHTETSGMLKIIRAIQEWLKAADLQTCPVLFLRTVADNATVARQSRRRGEFFRGLRVYAESGAETTHTAAYHRFQKDTVQAAGAAFRGLLLFVRIVTGVFVRDYLLGRFLKAGEELKLKSAVCREITLESSIG